MRSSDGRLTRVGSTPAEHAGARLSPRPAAPACRCTATRSCGARRRRPTRRLRKTSWHGDSAAGSRTTASAATGTDQATLRFLSNTADEAPVVVLGIFVHNVLRNVTGNFGLISNLDLSMTKPRFRLDGDGGLTLVPNPRLDAASLRDLLLHPERHDGDDYFALNGPEGAVELAFPYTLSLARALQNRRLWRGARRAVSGRPAWDVFLKPGHPSQGFEVTAAIAAVFARTARERGKRPIALMLPDEQAIAYFRAGGGWAYAELRAEVERAGFEVVDVGEAFMARAGGGGIDSFFARPGAPGSHYSDVGYRVVAETVAAAVTRGGSAVALRRQVRRDSRGR